MGNAFPLEIKDTTLMDAIVSSTNSFIFYFCFFQILATSFEQHQHPSGTIAISPDTTVTIAASGSSNAWSLRTLSESRCHLKTTMTQFLTRDASRDH